MSNASNLALAADVPNSSRDAGEIDDHFGAQLAQLRSQLMTVALFLTRDYDLANDLVQESLERALAARPQFHEGTSLKAWVTAILRNRFVDYRRHGSLCRRAETEPAWEPTETTAGPLDVLCWDDVIEALDLSSANERRIFVLFYLERQSYRDISRHLGISENTIGTRLFRTRKQLRKRLETIYARRIAQHHNGRIEPHASSRL